MAQPPTSSSDVAFTPSVKAEQEKRGSRRQFAATEAAGGFRTDMSDDLVAFLATRDSFYLATASAEGQPYIQHRGGPRGFLRTLGPRRLGFADFAGNRQYVTLGNLAENDRVCLFVMDYPNRQRVKIWGRARVVEDDEALIESLRTEGYRARVERAIVIEVTAWDINCRQHIQPRYDEDTLKTVVEKLTDQIGELQAEIARLKAASGV